MEQLKQLYQTLENRKTADPGSSYTARLFQMGEDEIIKKIGEEAIEVILAAKSQGELRIIEETADLTYHLLVLLVSKGITLDQIQEELKKRQK
ncbi:MAG: phosphoribosyl-ATP diphosphatase [Anaerolineaceae bacterium]|nr:phosphoribosyl-ATP diphosphatase [Anaerolineaceae bacterium]